MRQSKVGEIVKTTGIRSEHPQRLGLVVTIDFATAFLAGLGDDANAARHQGTEWPTISDCVDDGAAAAIVDFALRSVPWSSYIRKFLDLARSRGSALRTRPSWSRAPADSLSSPSVFSHLLKCRSTTRSQQPFRYRRCGGDYVTDHPGASMNSEAAWQGHVLHNSGTDQLPGTGPVRSQRGIQLSGKIVPAGMVSCANDPAVNKSIMTRVLMLSPPMSSHPSTQRHVHLLIHSCCAEGSCGQVHSSWVVKLISLAFRPGVESAHVDDNLTIGGHFDPSAIHRRGAGPSKLMPSPS